MVIPPPDKINQNIKHQSPSILANFGPLIKATNLISHRKKIGIPDRTLGFSPEQLVKQKDITPDFSLVHPESVEARLQRYVVLSYPSKKALILGKKALARNSAVISAVEPIKGAFLSLPNDYYFEPFDHYQWGMYDLNITNAWSKTTGHAYIGVPDGGLDINDSPTSHPDLTNYRSQFSKAFTYDFIPGRDDFQYNSGHGTHVVGIIAAATDNQTEGVAGVCWDCSISFAKINTTIDIIADGYNFLSNVGVQVINSSFQVSGFNSGGDLCFPANGFLFPNEQLMCDSIAEITNRDIIISAAAGNGLYTPPPITTPPTPITINNYVGRSDHIDFPASDHRTIAVGATNFVGNRTQFSDFGTELDLLAPGKNIFSTFTRSPVYKAPEFIEGGTMVNKEFSCGDAYGPGSNNDPLNNTPDGYGSCTGTSMSAPHITGILGLMRSTNPLLSIGNIKDALFTSAEYSNKVSGYGYGTPDAEEAVENVLGTVNGAIIPNRLTPLFSLYSSTGQDSLYTTVPQMAWSAFTGTILPQPSTPVPVSYQSAYGLPTAIYGKFPHDEAGNPPQPQPLAEVYIFTTKHNPISPYQNLAPLYRLSYQGANGSNLSNIDHVYTTDQNGILAYEIAGYKLDGMEGYIFSNQYAQPTGTEKLLRRYNPVRDDHAIFPESKLTAMFNAGYNVIEGNNGYIGYVYLNEDTDNDSLIDGFERAIGTCLNDSDSDNDGKQDGDEVLVYPYSDPLSSIQSCGVVSQPEYTWKNNATGYLYSNIPWNYAMGYHFTPQVTGTIDQLGGYFNGTKTVKLFKTSNGALLRQTTASANNSWGYGAITPVQVQAGTQYTVAVYLNGSGATYRNVGLNFFPKIYDNIKIDGSTFVPTYSNSNARPTNSFSNLMFGQADIRFTPL